MKQLRLLLTLLLSPLSALAADHHMALEELVVQGSALEETLPSELSDYGAELEVIGSEELDRTGVSDIGQALRGNVPGVYLDPKTGRGDYASVSIQGSRSEDVLWLVDGVRINNRLFGSTSPLDSISTHMVERIEILKGGQGLFYGTQAIAGVVNIVLRKPETDSGGNITGAIGSLGDRRLAGHVSNRNEYGRWLVFGEHDHSDGYRPYEDSSFLASARRQKRGFTRSSYGGRYLLDAGEGKSLNALVLRNDAEADFPRNASNFKAVNERDENIVSLKWDHQVTERNGYFIKAYWHDWWTDYTRLSMDSERDVTIVNDRAEWGYDDYGLNLTGRHTTDGGSQILGGVDYQRYQGEDYSLRIDGKTEAVTAGFVQYRPHLSFSPSTHLALGARYNHSNFGDDHSIWNISLKQPLPGDLSLKASVGTNFRLPSAFEMFVIDEDFPAGNEDLEPEESINTNVSLTGHIGEPIKWHLGGFYREIENLINVQDGTYANSDQTVRVHGAEVALNLGGDHGWQLDLDATWADSREGGSNEQIDGIPEWHANATLSWDGDNQGWQLNARHTGDVATTLKDLGQQHYGDHTLLSASAWHEFGVNGANRLTLRLENLRDKEYANGVGQADPAEGAPFRYETLGPPRNVQIEYSRSF
ncbi:hypothetical protein CK501_01340 [Halovibrio salipaludis]|uniref:TonB-dependent receptor n=2 Tax=Halovibrio salipaludis TaxID=2032626 RepID=A0A2A2FB53_9GAMM|nr:hypothetical protein CK501_01340 [Halovibrio salipaludis]